MAHSRCSGLITQSAYSTHIDYLIPFKQCEPILFTSTYEVDYLSYYNYIPVSKRLVIYVIMTFTEFHRHCVKFSGGPRRFTIISIHYRLLSKFQWNWWNVLTIQYYIHINVYDISNMMRQDRRRSKVVVVVMTVMIKQYLQMFLQLQKRLLYAISLKTDMVDDIRQRNLYWISCSGNELVALVANSTGSGRTTSRRAGHNN